MTGYMKLRELLLNRRALMVINVVFAAIVLVMLLVIVRDFFSSGKVKTGPGAATVDRQGKKRDALRLNDFDIVLKNNPFGFEGGTLNALGQGNAEKRSAPVAPSKYKLIGTIAASDRDSFAIFLVEGKQELYKIKSEIPGLGTLARVEPYRVIIKGDKEFELILDEIKGSNQIAGNGNGKKIVQASAPQGNSSKGDAFIKQTGEGAYALNAKMVQESIDNPQRLMTDARLVPQYKDGKQEGFKLSEVKKGGIYDSLGLQNGDVLLRINEYNITNPETALQAFTALRGVERLQLDVLRNNASVTLTYTIK